MAETDPEIKAMLDCLDAIATPEELEEYFAFGDVEILPAEAFACFPTDEGQ